MSKEYYQFKNEKGDTAFLIGLVDYISDRLTLACDYGYSLDVDIFPVPNNDLSLLSDVVKKRIHLYSEQVGNIDEDKINTINFNLKRIDGSDIGEYIHSKMKKYSSSDSIREDIDEFLSTLKWQLNGLFFYYI